MYKILRNTIEMDDYSIQRLSSRVSQYIWYKIWGNTVQSSTPTPSTPVDVKGVGDRTDNLYDKKSKVYQAYIVVASNQWRGSSTASSVRIPCQGNTTYTISTSKSYSIFRVAECNSNNVPVDGSTSSNVSINVLFNGGNVRKTTVTTSANAKYLIFQANANAVAEWTDSLNVNEGSEEKTYEEYCYKIPILCDDETKIVYLEEQLHKISDYADILSYSTHSCERKIKKLVLTGNENITTSTVSSDIFFVEANNVVITANIITVKCTHYEAVVNSSVRNLDINQINCSTTVQNRIAIRCEYTTISDLKNFFAEQYANGTPVTIWYVIETSETEQIKAPDILADTYTSITVDTEVQPSQVDFTTKGRHVPQPSAETVRKMNDENNSKTNDEEIKSIEETKEELEETIEKTEEKEISKK